MNKYTRNISNYIGLLLKSIHTIHQETKHQFPYRISTIKLEQTEIMVQFQVFGKNMFFEKELMVVMNDHAFLDELSPRDNRYLSYLTHMESIKAQYFIQSTRYSKELGVTIFDIKDIKSNRLIPMTATELHHSEIFPEKFNKEDLRTGQKSSTRFI